MPVEKAPLYLHFTYSLCLHAAALSLLITIPVLGGSGMRGGEYTVMLMNHQDAVDPGDNIEITDRQFERRPGRGRPADLGPSEEDTVMERPKNAEKNNVPKEDQLGNEDTAKMQTAGAANDAGDVGENIQLPAMADIAKIQTEVNPAADKPSPVPVPSNIAAASAGVPEQTTTVKPFFADVPSEPLPVSNTGAADKADAIHQAKTGPSIPTKTSAAVKPTTPADLPAQESHPAKPDVPEVLPAPEPESAKVPPMFIPAKTAAIEPNDTLPPGEATSQVPERIIAPAKTAVKVQKKEDVASSSDTVGSVPESRGKNSGGKSYPTKMPAGIASAKKDGQTGSSKDSGAGGLPPGIGTSSKKDAARGQVKSGGPRVAGGNGDGGTGNTAGTPAGSGKGYKLAAGSPAREFGLLRGTGAAFGEPTLARREGPSGKDIPENKEKMGTQEAPSVAIRVPEELLVQDIKIEVAAKEKELSDISMALARRAHPTSRKKYAADPERKIEEAEITAGKGGSGTPATKILTLRKAEKGIYIFSLTNAGEASSVAVVFRLYARSRQERIKEYKFLSLTPATAVKFKFLMPEAVFWDDTDRFSGIIEDSHSVTKFRYETGLLWKEEKER